ncbi:MAG: M23 family metallopeptidase [Aureispira sp.]|nr:M23 family metallopeptidase [Aureispira sp.]
MAYVNFYTLLICSLGLVIGSCQSGTEPVKTEILQDSISKVVKKEPTIPISDGFDYPVSNETKVTARRDGDGWYNAQDFKKNNHLGEDWNAESGGNTDCGKPVYAASKGLVVYSGDAGYGWGKVTIIRHILPDSSLIETLYGHLEEQLTKRGDVIERREQLGTVGDGAEPCGDGSPYYAHLHFEVRIKDCPAWGESGGGYSAEFEGWVDPSEFIDKHRNL